MCVGEPLKLERKPRKPAAWKMTWKGVGSALLKRDAHTLPRGMAGFLLNARFDNAALLWFHLREGVTAASGCPLRADVEPHSTTRCFKQAPPGTMMLWALHPLPPSASLGWPGWFTAWAQVAD